MKLSTYGQALGLERAVVGRVSWETVQDPKQRSETIYTTSTGPVSQDDLRGYRALLTTERLNELPFKENSPPIPVIHSAIDLMHLRTGDIVCLKPRTGYVRTLFRPDSRFNTIFATDRCNSNCLMCSQPPKDILDDELVEENLELIRLIDPSIQELGITGGEPTLLGEGLFRLLEALRDRFPTTHVHILTNGRRFAWPEFTARFSNSAYPNLSVGIPLYADVAPAHDYVVQAKGAFDQTVLGIHRLARYAPFVAIEIRIVLHAPTVPYLPFLAEYIYHNMPFVSHVAIMGLEMMGYTKLNIDKLWIDPCDYQTELRAAVEYLSVRGMHVSIYNHQLCVVDKGLWNFARKSISDWKNIYLDECTQCTVVDRCGGLFKSGELRHSRNIRAIHCEPQVLKMK